MEAKTKKLIIAIGAGVVIAGIGFYFWKKRVDESEHSDAMNAVEDAEKATANMSPELKAKTMQNVQQQNITDLLALAQKYRDKYKRAVEQNDEGDKTFFTNKALEVTNKLKGYGYKYIADAKGKLQLVKI